MVKYRPGDIRVYSEPAGLIVKQQPCRLLEGRCGPYGETRDWTIELLLDNVLRRYVPQSRLSDHQLTEMDVVAWASR